MPATIAAALLPRPLASGISLCTESSTGGNETPSRRAANVIARQIRFAALRGKASFSLAPVVVTTHDSVASGTIVARRVRYNFNARRRRPNPGPGFKVQAGPRTAAMAPSLADSPPRQRVVVLTS